MNDRAIQNMEIILDKRETHLHEVLEEMCIPHTFQTLDLADIDIRGTKGQRFLLERKTVSDLAASLRDGRFKNQKDRLLGVLQREPATSVAYILEGFISPNNQARIGGRVTAGMLRSLLNTIQLRYRIPVINTRSVNETGVVIRSIYTQLQSKPDFAPVHGGSNEGCAGHADLMPQIYKNSKDDVSSVWSSMLTAIRGISIKTAGCIIDHFQKIQQGGFPEYTRTHTRDEFAIELSNVLNGTRRLPKTICIKLVDVIYPHIETNIRCETEDVDNNTFKDSEE